MSNRKTDPLNGPPDPLGRVGHPEEHFPYKLNAIQAALAEDAPAGPAGPDDDSKRVSDYTSPQLIAATATYVAAQEAHLLERTPAAKREYAAATANLAAARAYHRRNRVNEDGSPRMRICGEGG